MTRAVTFTQAQVRRAVKAAESAGLRVRKVTVNPDGSITVDSGDNAAPAVDSRKATLAASWDELMGKMAVLKLKYINEYRDRTGKLRRYFRKGAIRKPAAGRSRLPGIHGRLPGDARRQAGADGQDRRQPRPAHHRILRLRAISAASSSRRRQTYRYALEPIAKVHGHRTAAITHRQAAKLISDIGDRSRAWRTYQERPAEAVQIRRQGRLARRQSR